MRTWLYHPIHGARLFNVGLEEFNELWADGWRDTETRFNEPDYPVSDPYNMSEQAFYAELREKQEAEHQRQDAEPEADYTPGDTGEPPEDVNLTRSEFLLAQFQREPKELTKDEHVELGETLGLELKKTWREDTLIARIQEQLNGDDAPNS